MENENKVETKETAAKTSASAVWKGKGAACKEKMCAFVGKNKKTIIAVLVLIVLVVGSFVYSKYLKSTDIGLVAAKAKIQKFIDANVPAGTIATIKDIAKEGDLYKVTLSVNGQDIPLYLTRDGKNLIQQLIDIDKASQKQSDATNPAAASAEKSVPDQKQAVPDVKLFVMSFCPYGTQMEKGILPVLSALGSKIKFSLEFVDYSMHGANEIDENLRQYCIQKNQPTKLNAYLTCYLKVGQGTADACMKTAGINAAQVASCTAQTDAQFSVKANAADQTKWDNGSYPPFAVNKDDNTAYGVQGSPTLVVNGTAVSANRDPASLLKTICSGFTTAPKECSKVLSTTTPAPGFGTGTTTAGTSSGAACATPAQ